MGVVKSEGKKLDHFCLWLLLVDHFSVKENVDNVHTFESTLDIAKRSRVYGFLKRVNKGVLNTDKAKEPSCGKTYCSMPQSLRFFHFTSKRENPFPKICIIVAIL